MMKRGAAAYPLFMDQRPLVGESYVKRAEKALRAIREHAPVKDFRVYTVQTGEIMDRILAAPAKKFVCILCKRSMYRIAEALAESVRAKGIITGESLGQVASQTLENLYVLDSAVRIPVFRPIIGWDKVEIERVARRIGTYDLTAKLVEGCAVVPDKPATRSKIDKIEKLEKDLELNSMCYEAAMKIKTKVLD
jgi:thiamine biosynthesis protein ThiI